MRNAEMSKRRNVETSKGWGSVCAWALAVVMCAPGLPARSDPPIAPMRTDKSEVHEPSVLSASSVHESGRRAGAAWFALDRGFVLASTEAGASTTGEAGVESVDPYQAVRQGNELLKQDRPREALRYYDLAAKEKPDVREIAFAEGLAHYHLGDYEKARELFRRAADGRNDALADDAIYSLGTTYHGDALLSKDDPKAAMGMLEEAMQHYQSVLSHRPDHETARDAYRKAGAMWRLIKQQMEQQPQQQQPGDPDQNNEDQDEQDQQRNEQNQRQEDQEDEDQDQQDRSPEPDDQQEQQQPSPSDQQSDEEQDQQDQTPSESEDEQEDEAPSPPDDQDQEELVSREQAERKLREMMHELRERRRDRQEPQESTPVQPVDKDW